MSALLPYNDRTYRNNRQLAPLPHLPRPLLFWHFHTHLACEGWGTLGNST